MHGAIRNPVLFNFNKPGGTFDHLLNIVSGDSQLYVTRVHTSEVLIDSVNMNALVHSLVRLDTFETLDRVIKSGVLGHQFEGSILNDLGSLPATVLIIIVNFKHIIGGDTAESVLVVSSRLFLEYCALFEN